MPPRKRPNRGRPMTQTPPPPPPPPQFDPVLFQTAVTAAMDQMNSGDASGAGMGTNSRHGEIPSRTQGCTYKDFMNCKPTFFNGTGGILALSQWIERVEAVFKMCSRPEESKIKFVAATFTERALTWWNGHVNSLSLVTANAMGWDPLKDLLRKEYCPRGEVQKLEEELWNLKMKGTDIVAYTARFCDLVAMCPNMIPSESKKIERYIWV